MRSQRFESSKVIRDRSYYSLLLLLVFYALAFFICYFSFPRIHWSSSAGSFILTSLTIPFLLTIIHVAYVTNLPPPTERSPLLKKLILNPRYFTPLMLLAFLGGLSILAFKTRNQKRNLVVDLLQINDVYEIAPLEGGKIGGMARVATLKRRFELRNRNTMLLIAGDFISPSVFNSVKKDNVPVEGRQMIAAMNAAGVDLAIFGNHEFDVARPVLQQRINESTFQWVASNVFDTSSGNRKPFAKNGVNIPPTWKRTFTTDDGNSVTIGFFGITIPDNVGPKPSYAGYTDPMETAVSAYNELASGCDAVIAITHQDVKDDSLLALRLPGLAAIIGGHEHDERWTQVGNVWITKAYANAKNAFHLNIRFRNDGDPIVTPERIQLDRSVMLDNETDSLCNDWMKTAFDYFKSQGFEPDSPIRAGFAPPQLEGRDSYVRRGPTNLTRIVIDAMAYGASKEYKQDISLAILNSGSIRIDDAISPPVTQYALLRAMPFSDTVRVAVMKGRLIARLLDSAAGLTDQGGFLQYSGTLQRTGAGWMINGQPLKDSGTYTVAIGNYLVSGQQKGLKFINTPGAGLDSVYPKPINNKLCSVSKTVIDYLQHADTNDLAKYY